MVRVEEKSSFRTTEIRCWFGVSFSPLGENQEMSLYLASPATGDNKESRTNLNECPEKAAQGELNTSSSAMQETDPGKGLLVPEKQANGKLSQEMQVYSSIKILSSRGSSSQVIQHSHHCC